MEGLYYQLPMLDGWANNGPYYDHRFMGYDRAPYQSVYVPAQPMRSFPGNEDLEDPEFMPGMMSDDSSSSEDESQADEGADIYAHVGLHKIEGKQMAVWCHRMPDTLAIFTPIPGDTLATAVSFARSSLRCDPAMDRVLLLVPGHKRPVDPTTLQAAQLGCSMLVVPKYDYVVTLEVSQLKVKLQMVVGITMTVRQVKAALQHHRGFPVNRTDLLFKDSPMENHRHLFDYHVRHGSTLFVMLHLLYDVRVTVETFWGQNYEVYVDPCMTTASLLDTVLRRTISPQAGDVSTFFHLLLPRHALVMYSDSGAAMRWSGCLGLYGAREGATFNLSTIALAHQMSVQSVPVAVPGDKVHHFRISKYDYWSVLALKLHGLLGYPVNLIRLFRGKRELDLARAAGPVSPRSSPVRLDTALLKTDPDVYGGVGLTFRLGTDVEEELILSPTRTVRSVKTLLEEVGIPNATVYDLFVDGIPLPDSGRIGDVIEEHKRPIDLKLKHYPVFVHGPQNVIYKMTAHAQEALKVFKGRVELKTGLSQRDYYMLMAGMPVADRDSRPVFESSLAIGSSVFLMGVQQRQIFFVVWDDWLVKLRLPFVPQPSEIKEILLKDRNIPEGSLASLGHFLQWYFAMKATKKDLMHDYVKNTQQMAQDGRQRQSRPRKRRDRSEAAVWGQYCRQIQELQQALEDRYQTPPRGARHAKADPQNHHRRHHHRGAGHAKPAPSVQVLSSSTDSSDGPGLFYATHRHGRWQRINPEDLTDSYLRAWSLPPDPVHKVYSRHHNRLKKARSAMPDVHAKGGGASNSNNNHNHHNNRYRRKDPEWVYNLRQMAQEDKVKPAHVRFTRKKRRKRRMP